MATEKRLIDANAIPWEEYYVPDPDSDAQWDYKKELSVTKPVIDQMPTIDAVEVVWCEDCKYRVLDTVNGEDWCNHTLGLCGEVYATDFCCHGERKED